MRVKSITGRIFCLSFFCLVCLTSGISFAADTKIDVQSAAHLLRAKDFEILESRLMELEQSKDKNEDGFYMFYPFTNQLSLELIKTSKESMIALDLWCLAHQNSYMAHLIRGRFYLFYAWAARGSDFANKVNPDAWPLFEERLKLAEKDLQRAISLNTLSPEPWVYLVHVYRGLSYSVKEDEAFGKVKERDNYYYKAYFLRLTSLMPKWGGDVEGMFTFARESYKEHASDPIFGLLILEAHDEMASINRRLTKGVKQSDYYKVPEHFQEMRDIVDLILKEHPQSNHARNWSAKIDYLGDKYEEALKQLVDLGDLIDEDVWSKQYVENIKKRLLRQHLRADPEGMLNSARKSYKEHPDDPIFGFLVLEAHDEMSRIAKKLIKDGNKSDYYKVPEHFQEMRSIVDRILKEHPQSTTAKNWSAKIDYLGNRHAEALKQLVELGDLIDEEVWVKEYVERAKKWLMYQYEKGKL